MLSEMALGQRNGERFRMRYKRLLIAALLILFVSCSVIVWNSHKSYSIENWQVVNHQQEFVPYGYLLKFKERADQMDDSKIYNIARYKASLINQARAMGIAQGNLATAFTTAESEQPQVDKIPVYIETVNYKNRDAFAITFKFQADANRFTSFLRLIWPLKIDHSHYQVTVIDKENNTILYTGM
jgi:hypothetical protein